MTGEFVRLPQPLGTDKALAVRAGLTHTFGKKRHRGAVCGALVYRIQCDTAERDEL